MHNWHKFGPKLKIVRSFIPSNTAFTAPSCNSDLYSVNLNTFVRASRRESELMALNF